MLIRSITRIALPAILCCGLLPSQAKAGPLIDWLFGINRAQPAYPVGPPVPVGGYGANYAPQISGYAPQIPYSAGYGANYLNYSNTSQPGYAANYGNYYGSNLPVIGPAGAGYPNPQPSGIAAATMPQTLSYVPNYNTYANRAPVTYYRPLLTTDPNTGAQVVAMAPCTSYEYQAQRVPSFGRSALYGANVPPVVPRPAPALPTYTLPSGGIPLAGPSATMPYTSGYAPYSQSTPYTMLQPATGYPAPGQVLVAPGGSYSTTPYSSLQYGSTIGGSNGGSSGTYYGPATPGLIAPQGPSTSGPTMPGPTTSPYPSESGPAAPSGVYPDPADIPPSLPPATFPTTARAQDMPRPQLRSITRQPASGNSSSEQTVTSPERKESPVLMKPIPVPDDFEKPNWRPGLLSESDMTAMNIAPERAKLAGQSKPIHWASFEQPATPSSAVMQTPVPPTRSLRPVTQPQAAQPLVPQPQAVQSRTAPTSTPAKRRYDNTGWQAAK
ncbi:MAG: hypothetical protein R3C53_15275 [Pirellulaceae bacterium]